MDLRALLESLPEKSQIVKFPVVWVENVPRLIRLSYYNQVNIEDDYIELITKLKKSLGNEYKATENVQGVLVRHKEGTCLSDVASDLRGLGLRIANAWELLNFGKKGWDRHSCVYCDKLGGTDVALVLAAFRTTKKALVTQEISDRVYAPSLAYTKWVCFLALPIVAS